MEITPEMQSALNEAAAAAVKSLQPAEPAAPAPDMDATVQAAVKSYLDKYTNELGVASAPSVSKSGLGDTYVKATAAFVRSGQSNSGIKANNTDMNIGTAADGGYAVPTGHYQGIVARMSESDLTTKLGLLAIPGTGTTVNVVTDAADAATIAPVGEALAATRDAPVLGMAAMTLVKFPIDIEMSTELLDDEDSRLMAYLENWVGRQVAITRNSLLLTEVATNGAALKTFAATGAIAAGELEDIAYSSNIGYYLTDGGNIAWVTRPPTYGALTKLSGNFRWYGETAQGNISHIGPEILSYPVHFSQAAAAPAASAKSVFFGNWNYVGFREGSGMSFLRDPYSKASTGQIVLHYSFRVAYKVLASQAIGYGIQAAV